MDTRNLMMALAVMLGVMGLAVPRLGKNESRLPEIGALKTMAAIHSAESQYFSERGRYAGALEELNSPGDVLPARLAQTGEQGGYRFVVSRTDRGYAIISQPVHCGGGVRSFYSDESLRTYGRSCPEAATDADALVN